uniref:BspA family leucine-rich repeat surface protein n=1 Tax=Corethron hystrix TaxID=216773 RepID=A0A7S1C2P9_9STRA
MTDPPSSSSCLDDASLRTALSLWFSDRPSAESLHGPLPSWPTCAATSLALLFYERASFSSPLSGWDVSRVTDLSWAFVGASAFDGDVAPWDVSEVTRAAAAFGGASAFDGDVRGWDVSRVEDTTWMFFAAASFDRDLSNWDVGNVGHMAHMFKGARSFRRELRWCPRKGAETTGMFTNSSGSLRCGDEVGPSVASVGGDFVLEHGTGLVVGMFLSLIFFLLVSDRNERQSEEESEEESEDIEMKALHRE